MGSKEDEDFYLNLSKKELQCLCNKYGLSPNKTKSNLVKSLISYFEKKNLSSISSGERLHGTQEAFLPKSLIPPLEHGAQLNSTRDARKDGYHPREEVRKGNYSQAVKCYKLGSCMGSETYNKAPGAVRVGDMPQMQSRDINFGSCPAKNAFAPSMKSSTEVPSSSFEFYVRSEEGINLYVDLNSSPSEWTTRLKEGVCISQNVQNKNSHCLHQELGHFGDINKQTNHSFLWNTDSSHGINDGHVQTRPSPSSIMIENGHVGFDRPDGGDESLRSLAIKPCSISADMLGHSEEDHTLLFSSRPSSEVQDPMISGTESYPRVEGTLTLDSDVSDTPQIKSACDSAVILTFDGVKSFDTLDHQNSKVSNSIFEKSSLQMTCSLAIPSMVYPGCSASGSLKMQLSEVTSPHKDILRPTCENGGFLDLDDPMNNVERENGGLANSIKLSDGTHGNNPPTSAEEWERSDHIDGKENSECSQFNSTEKICLRSDDSESSEGLQKKRQHNDDENSNSCGKPDAKRSMKNHTGEVHPRRSMRLVSK